MAKKILSLFLVLVMLFGIVACNGSNGETNPGSSNGETTPDSSNGETTPVVTTPESTGNPDIDPPPGYVPEGDFKYAEWLAPIWEGNVVYDEYVMFLGKNDVVPLLYPATEIISVKSTDGKTTFTEGVDYKLVDGKLVMPEGSSLTYIPEEVYWSKGVSEIYTYKDGKSHITYAAGWDGMAKYQVAVTYKHGSTPAISVPDCSDTFAAFIKKLEEGEDVTVIFNGDSITEGWDSSIRSNFGERTPHWPALFTHYLAYKYDYTVKYVNLPLAGIFSYPKATDVYGDRGTITYINNAVSGWNVTTGYNNLGEYAINPAETYGCDLFFYAYGMNNSTTHPDYFAAVVEMTVRKFNEVHPDAAIVLVSSMLPNNESVGGMGDIPYQEEKLIELRDNLKAEGIMIEVAPMTSVHSHMCSVKRYRDHSGNNVNHPGDYTHRVYAQVALQTVLGYCE
jgi:hypothetical protein